MRRHREHVLALFLVLTWSGATASAQKSTANAQENPGLEAAAQAQAQTQSHVSAEMTKGKLNPATSKPGDEIALRLNEDAKANGQVLLKKGSTVKGVVRKVHRSDGKADAKGAAQSMIELEWIAPAVSGSANQQMNFALQSIVYTNPLYAHQMQQESGDSGLVPSRPAPSSRGSASGGLLGGAGGVAGGTVASATSIGGGVAGAPGAVTTATAAQTQSRLAAPPLILPASPQTSAALQSSFGVSGNQLYAVGNGQATSSGGTTTSMDLFTHMSNDTVITSPSRDFEVSSGAQMQLLVR